MIRWVVTGPIGAGKSTVTAWLARRGAAVVDGDRLGHEVLADPAVVAEVAAAFGPGTVAEGQVDRTVLGPLVFADPSALARLNGITHGRIAALARRRLDELEKAGNHGLAVLEAAVYFLFPAPPPVDLVIAVVADPVVRAARLAARRGLTAPQAAARLAAQADLAPLWRSADVVLDNSGDELQLQRRLDQLLLERLPGGFQGRTKE